MRERMAKKIFLLILFCLPFFSLKGATSFDLGLECLEQDLKSLKVLSSSKLIDSGKCFLNLSCTPNIYASPFQFSCNGDRLFVSVNEDIRVNSLVVINDKIYITKFTKDKVGGELRKLKSGEKKMEQVYKTNNAYLYLHNKGRKIYLYKWISSKCTQKTVRRKFWEGCFRRERVDEIVIE